MCGIPGRLLVTASFLALLTSPSFGEAEQRVLLPFEPEDTIEDIRYKIDYNGYSFTVEESRVFNMSPEERVRFLSRRAPLQPRRLAPVDDVGPLAEYLGRRLLPPGFDWRDYGGHSYIGDIRDQGDCGSCYSFGACAAAEGTYNFAMGLYDGSCADFSEAFVAFCLSDYYSGFDGCSGSDYDYEELDGLVDYGVCNESAFTYTDTEQPCQSSAWSAPRVQFLSWHRITCNDVDAIKTAIMIYGVVDAAVYAGSAWSAYSGGVYQDTSTSCGSSPCYYTPTNHIIALVGWDDSPPEGGGGVWILRNSWGESWGEDGYMRTRFTSARVSCEACYLVLDPPAPTPTPTMTPTPVYTPITVPATINFQPSGATVPQGCFRDSGEDYLEARGYGWQ